MATTASPLLSFREVLRDRAVRRLWIAQIVSIFGDFLAVFAVFALVTFKLHGTPTQVSMILVSYLAPLAIISPLAGVYVDRWNVKWTMIASDAIRGVLVLTLVFVQDLNTIYAVFFALSTVSSFFMPAQSVAVRTIAPAAGLMTVNALMTQAVQASQIIAPGVSGAMVQLLGANSCFLFDSFSFFFSAAMVATLTIHREKPAQTAGAGSVLSSMSTGFRFILTHSAISFVIVSMTAGMFAVRCFGALLSVYVRDILHSKEATFGVLNMLIGTGMIVGSTLLTRLARAVRPQHMVTYGLAGMGACVFFTAIFGRTGTTAAGMLGLGFFAAFIMVTAQTLLQQETPQEMLGRVSSSLMSLMAVSQVVAMFVAGPVAEKAGIRNLYFGSAAMLLCIGLIGHFRMPAPQAAVQAAQAD
jgi:predicted MFS family arabinose efflux permease